MDKQLSDQTFESRLQNLIGNVLCYVDYKNNSGVDVIVLHQHLGLQNYVRVMAQSLIYNQFSIIYPNLFGEAEEESQDDSSAYLRSLDQEKIAVIVLSMINFVAGRGNKIVLIGFSLGAAIGLKLLQYTNKVDFAFFFYGLPPLQTINPRQIKAKVTIFMGTKDKVKHLSDGATRKRAKELYGTNSNITWIDIEGGKHGFMNPACDSYDEKAFGFCCEEVHKQVKQLATEHQFSQVRISAPNLTSFESLPNEQPPKVKGTEANLNHPESSRLKVQPPEPIPEEKKEKEDSGCALY